jgi:pseudouridine-5'-phosphate glycosidase
MRKNIPHSFILSQEVARAIQMGQPLVALESTVITHGLPYPENLQLARDIETEVRNQSAIPATIAILAGKIKVGLSDSEIVRLASGNHPVRKISRRDFGIAIARGEDGGTTVSGTITSAWEVGIQVMATGGIGGVHRGNPFDISSDLPALSSTPVIVVCSGAKAILDLPATMETLETMGVPVLGYQTPFLPAFYSASSGLPVTAEVNSPAEIVSIARSQWDLGLENAILVVVPPPVDVALSAEEIEKVIQQALLEADEQQIVGSAVTPFLLRRVSELSGGASLRANLALLRSNAAIAARIAVELARNSSDRI